MHSRSSLYFALVNFHLAFVDSTNDVILASFSSPPVAWMALSITARVSALSSARATLAAEVKVAG